MNDPREMVVRPESGVTLEQDNRVEEMYHWGAMVVDLCDLPVEEYMKPMTVIGLGGGGDIPETMYTLYFKIDGVTVAQKSLKSGDTIPFSVNGEKDGRNFLGWFDGNTQYFEGALMPSKSLTLKAKYSCDVNFIFVEDGVEREVSAYTVDYNSKLTSIPSTANTGYDFLGWNPSIPEVVKVHTTFKAVFESITYTVVWNGYVDGPIIVEYKYGDVLEEPTKDPEKEGYTFKGWNEEIPENVTSNLEFNPIFEVLKFNIILKQNYEGNVEILSSYTQDYGSVIVLPQIPSENGYSFTEWEGEYNGNTVPSYDIEYVTIKTINSYILAYYVDNNLEKEETYKYLSIITPYVFEKEGYNVSPWMNLPTEMPAHNVSAFCSTEIMKFTVSFTDQNGDVIYSVDNVEYGTVIGDIAQPVKEGYTYNVLSDINGAVKENLTINGKFIINQYDVIIIVNGNEETIKLNYGDNIVEYVKENYKPDEGYELEAIYTHTNVPADNTAKVTVSYKPLNYILTYSTEGADENISGSKEVAFGTNILSELPSTDKEGYDFNGWFDEEGKQLLADDTMPNKDLTVIGTYDIKSFEVSIFDEDIKIFNKSYVYKAPISSVLNDEAIVEYVTAQSAIGQTVSFVLNGEPVNEDMEITSNIDIYVEKTPIEYLLTFMNGNEIISETLVKFGETINYPSMENKTEEGVEYVFVWEDSSYNGKTMPAKDLKIVGNYQEKAEAPVYYGVFITSSTTADSRIFNTNDLKQYFKTVKVNDCLDGEDIVIEMATDPELLDPSLSDREFEEYQDLHLYPACFLIPVDVDEKYEFIAVLKADNKQKNFVTDGVDIDIEGNKYHLYTFLNPDSMKAQDFNQNWKYNIILK